MTADRYVRIFRALGWRAHIANAYDGEPVDCLVGLHARKSASSVLAFRKRFPRGRLVLVLTGTDLYRDIADSALARRALDAADLLVTLQPEGLAKLPRILRSKARAIVQSAEPGKPAPRRPGGPFEVCVLGHLRHEKDPMRAAYALRLLDPQLRVRVTQAGGILAPRFARATHAEMLRNPRYRYCGELSRTQARRLLARSDLMVLSSRMEGGANALCEAIACGIPVLASRIAGNTGILGRTYPGLYPTGDSRALAALLKRCVTDRAFYERLRSACRRLAPLVSFEHELAAWRRALGNR